MTLGSAQDFEKLIEYLRDSRGFDFTGYKRASLIRRVSQRCAELGIDDYRVYLDYLHVHPEEFGALFTKILINITEFFRDKHAWDYLAEKIVPRIVAKNGDIRIWSTGTSSGEEAYSAAMLFCEAMGEASFVDRVKIYATDVDEEALSKGRGGYRAKDLDSLPETLRSKYFEGQGERLMFRSAQSRILARFHYALNDDGYLFLGRSEMILSHTGLFTSVDVKQHIFTKVAKLRLRERLMVLAQSGNAEANNHVTRQLRVRELTTEGTPHPQLVVDMLGVLISANLMARQLLAIDPDDIGRTLRDLD